jgi:hypothetical protein
VVLIAVRIGASACACAWVNYKIDSEEVVESSQNLTTVQAESLAIFLAVVCNFIHPLASIPAFAVPEVEDQAQNLTFTYNV